MIQNYSFVDHLYGIVKIWQKAPFTILLKQKG